MSQIVNAVLRRLAAVDIQDGALLITHSIHFINRLPCSSIIIKRIILDMTAILGTHLLARPLAFLVEH